MVPAGQAARHRNQTSIALGPGAQSHNSSQTLHRNGWACAAVWIERNSRLNGRLSTPNRKAMSLDICQPLTRGLEAR
jgi:hypothetical protein